MATDKLANMREPVLSLDLDIKEKSGIKQVSVELSKDELKELITSLEAANKVLNTVSCILCAISADEFALKSECFMLGQLL